MADTWTIDAMRKWTTNYFANNGIETPQLDTDVMLAAALGVEKIQLLINGDQVLTPETIAQFKQYILRRVKKREPVAYILGHREFWSFDLKVSPATLIPRPDTECLVEAVLNAVEKKKTSKKLNIDESNSKLPSVANASHSDITYEAVPDERMASYLEIWAAQDSTENVTEEELAKKAAIPEVDENGVPLPTRDISNDVTETGCDVPKTAPIKSEHAQSDSNKLRIVDIGTGTGAIALALASELPDADVTAIDISDDALMVAKENAQNLKLDRVKFINSDLLSNVSGKFDVIVSNPPYVSPEEYAACSPEVKCEPKLALLAGERGLDVYRKLVPLAFTRLNPDGILAVEIGYKQGEDVSRLFTQAGFKNVKILNDYADQPRIVIGNI